MTTLAADLFAHPAAQMMTRGGDARIVLDPATLTNRYFSTPWPRDLVAYASSTANDISAEAFTHVSRMAGTGQDYGAGLDDLRTRIRTAYALSEDTRIVFAPSGTDLEYVALAAMLGRSPGGTRNILLGADEVGSGCIHSAHGNFFAGETALGVTTRAGAPVPGLGGHVDMFDIPVRDEAGRARTSAAIRQAMYAAISPNHLSLLHIVHGSKTGLVLPHLDEIDDLRAAHGDAIALVVDACQARITSQAIDDYLARGAIVFLTGSKFMGGPPFSGFALIPAVIAAQAPVLPAGFRDIFRRAEWPMDWPGAETLRDEANPGLLLRLEAAIFELERFQKLPLAAIERVVLAFHAAVRITMVDRLGGRRVAPYAPGGREEADDHPIEMRTLSTIDISGFPSQPDFEASQALHKALIGHGVRLGQPVKCARLPDDRWGGTLRLGLSMPQIVALQALDDGALAAKLASDMDVIAAAIEAECIHAA